MEKIKKIIKEFEEAKIAEVAETLAKIYATIGWEWSGRQYPKGVPTKEIFITEITKRIADLRASLKDGKKFQITSIGGGRFSVIAEPNDEKDAILEFRIEIDVLIFPVEYEYEHAITRERALKRASKSKEAS